MIRNFLKSILGEKYTENNAKLLKVNYAIIILLFIFSAVMLKFMPAQMPMQWAADGSVNYTLPSYLGIWIGPAILLAVNILLTKQDRIHVISTCAFAVVAVTFVYFYLKAI